MLPPLFAQQDPQPWWVAFYMALSSGATYLLMWLGRMVADARRVRLQREREEREHTVADDATSYSRLVELYERVNRERAEQLAENRRLWDAIHRSELRGERAVQWIRGAEGVLRECGSDYPPFVDTGPAMPVVNGARVPQGK